MRSTKKIVIIGPESTGKSTLTQMLARHYKMPFVNEYAREYLEQLHRDYTADDLEKIAAGQIGLEENKLKESPSMLFCDTDLYVIKVWSEHKYRRCATQILQQIANRSYDLYILTDIDMPWEEDPQREYPDPLMRQYFYKVYEDIVIHSGLPWAKVSGNPDQRLNMAVGMIASTLF